jgi:hypothetical protein
MNILKKALIAGGCAVILTLGTNTVMAQGQGRGNFDPAQMKQRMMDGARDALEIKDDAEWTAIEPKISKVYDARRDVMASVMRGMGMGRCKPRRTFCAGWPRNTAWVSRRWKTSSRTASCSRSFPARVLLKEELLPLQRVNGVVEVATSRLFATQGLDTLKTLTGLKVKPVLAPTEAIRREMKSAWASARTPLTRWTT